MALAIVQASPVDCGVYQCTIHNEHGSASTDFCLSAEGECAPSRSPPQPGSEGGCSVQAGQPEGSCFLFFFSAQCCRDSSREKKAKV